MLLILEANMENKVGTGKDGFVIRTAQPEDMAQLLCMVRELAEYEQLLHSVTATEDIFKESFFKKKSAEALIGEYRGRPVAMAIFFHNFSSFIGKAGLYIEDIYVRPKFRGMGFGKYLLLYIAKVAIERNCGRLEWSVLDWNVQAIGFYKKLGAVPLEDWTVFRIDEKLLRIL
jgi:GNAT superfamily N-acetyltransferase